MKNNIEDKAIQKVKEKIGESKNAKYAIDYNASLPSNQLMVKITEDAVTIGWYIVNTETWEETEY